MSALEFVRATSRAFVLEAAFHFACLTIEAARRLGVVKAIQPEVYPFRSLPPVEAAACCAAAVGLAIDPSAWWAYDVAMLVHLASYLWVETGIDVVVITVLVLAATPSLLVYAQLGVLAIAVTGVAALLSQQRLPPFALWMHAAMLLLLTAARVLARTHPLIALIFGGLAAEVACEAFRQRTHGRWLRAPTTVSYGLATLLWMTVGIQVVDARDWLGFTPNAPSGLPEAVRGNRLFCGSRVVRGLRLHSGRRVSEREVAIAVGEWDELCFAPSLGGFVLSLLASIRVPFSIRAAVEPDEGGTLRLTCVRPVVCFFELPPSAWDAMAAPTGDQCMLEGACVLVPTRLTLRRATEALLSWVFFTA